VAQALDVLELSAMHRRQQGPGGAWWGQQQNDGMAAAIAAADAAVGVHQHHDAMSGTDLAFVAQNYVQMLSTASGLVTRAAAATAANIAGEGPNATAGASGCEQRNISVCPATGPLAAGTDVVLLLFNPLGQTRSEVVAVPVPVPGVVVVDANGVSLPSEVHPAVFSGMPLPYLVYCRFGSVSIAGTERHLHTHSRTPHAVLLHPYSPVLLHCRYRVGLQLDIVCACGDPGSTDTVQGFNWTLFVRVVTLAPQIPCRVSTGHCLCVW